MRSARYKNYKKSVFLVTTFQELSVKTSLRRKTEEYADA
jgi:hypothetical protein